MRVLFFTHEYTTHDLRWLTALAASRHEIVHLRIDRSPTVYERRPIPDGVRALELPPAPPGMSPVEGRMHRMPALERVLAEVKPDLIHAGPIQSAGLMAALSGHHPLLVASWSFDLLLDADQSDTMRWATRYTLARADWMLVDSDAVREALPRWASIPDDRIVQMPWGLDLSRPVFGQARPAADWPRADGTIEIISTRTWGPMGDIDRKSVV